MDTEKRKERKQSPRASSNFLSSLFFLYMFPIFYSGFKRGLSEDDLFEPLNEHKSDLITDKLEQEWNKCKKYKKWGLHLALFRTFGIEFVVIGILTLCRDIGTIILNPILIGKIVSYFSTDQSTMTNKEVSLYSAGLVLFMFIDRMLSHPPTMWITHIAMKIRVSCSSLIYRKTLKLSKSVLSENGVGRVVNLVSNDLGKFDFGCLLLHFTWVSPIQTLLGTYFLYCIIGESAFIGVGFLLLFLPIQMFLARRTSVLRLRTALRTDERVRLMNEIINAIQVIKMYTWERPFAELISCARKKEMQSIRTHKILSGLNYSFEIFVTPAAIFLCLVSYVLINGKIDAQTAFAVTTIFDVMRGGIMYFFPKGLTWMGELHISTSRVRDFLDCEELVSVTNSKNQHKDSLSIVHSVPKIDLKDVYAKWDRSHSEDTLANINLQINQCELLTIIGPVGSGKSSLLNVLLNELPIRRGCMDIEGSISFSSQEPWLFSASVKQNITFDEHYDEERYKKVCKVCALEPDFAQLPYGDRTLVGEKGKALSGGQKARINLARCVYRNSDIYLLDDPLSAVDTNVGRQLFYDCIKSFLSGKIVVLVTHQLQYLKDADRIAILKEGYITDQGSYKELMTHSYFAKLLGQFQVTNEEINFARANSFENKDQNEILQNKEELIEPETVKESLISGVISFKTYRKYFRAGGNYFVIFILLAVIVASQMSSSLNDYYISHWVNIEQDFVEDNSTSTDELQKIRTDLIYQYTGITLLTIIMAIFHIEFLFIFLTNASANLHKYIFDQLCKAKMKFFNENPSGRILNRFSKDLGVMDEYIPIVTMDVIEVVLRLFGTMILTSIVDPLLIVPGVLLIVFFYSMRLVLLRTSRSVKRIEGITRSPILNHLTTTINGLSTIRAFNAEKVLMKEFDNYQDLHSSAWFIFLASTRAFGFWMDLIGLIFIAAVIFTTVNMQSDLYGGEIGLIITQYVSLMKKLQFGVRQWTELENQMTSVERVLEYTKLENEPIRPPFTNLPKIWPSNGKLQFRDVSMSYQEKEEPVLKHVNFTVLPGEKVGVVGRTGAGKTSIIVSLFQLYDIEGSILIDEIDTTNLSLDIVRPKISIIPQEPILFRGTIRQNLDPFKEYDDEVLWHALEHVELKDTISEVGYGLNSSVCEGGLNFSVGQRQLLCLARAIIRKNKILILDEATANVDPHTDFLIQKTIRQRFADFTVLTIAHRLNTVMDSDKILVMDAGRVVEFDTPHKVLKKKNEYLSK